MDDLYGIKSNPAMKWANDITKKWAAEAQRWNTDAPPPAPHRPQNHYVDSPVSESHTHQILDPENSYEHLLRRPERQAQNADRGYESLPERPETVTDATGSIYNNLQTSNIEQSEYMDMNMGIRPELLSVPCPGGTEDEDEEVYLQLNSSSEEDETYDDSVFTSPHHCSPPVCDVSSIYITLPSPDQGNMPPLVPQRRDHVPTVPQGRGSLPPVPQGRDHVPPVPQGRGRLPSLDEQAKKLQRVKHVVMEIVKTEETYVEQLNKILQVKTKFDTNFSPVEVRPLFGSIVEIHQLHTANLPKLQERCANWEQEHRLGDFFCEIAPHMKMYTEYMKAYEVINDIYKQKDRGPNAALYRHFRKIEVSREFGASQIHNFLVAPVQRLPRYKLLLEEYLRHLPERMKDGNDVKNALTKIFTVSQHFEKGLADHGNLKKVLEIQNRIIGNPSLVHPARSFIKETNMKVFKVWGNNEDRKIILFNDLILVCREMRNNSLKKKHAFDLHMSRITEHDQFKKAMLLTNPAGSKVQIAFDSEGAMREWKEEISQLVNKLAKTP